jgi:hypothetical protein
LTTATLPGIKLFHEGQLDGRKVRLPVFLGRRPDEPLDRDLHAFYQELLELINRPAFREGRWHLCDRTGWPDNTSFQNLLTWSWLANDERYVIVVNLSEYGTQARVQVPWADAGSGTWRLIDGFSRATYDRDGGEMVSPGLYVDLAPWNYHFLKCLRIDKTSIQNSAKERGNEFQPELIHSGFRAVCYIDKGESRPVSRNLRKLCVLAGCGGVPNE